MSWICPHCGTTATLQSSDLERGSASEMIKTAPDNEGICLSWQAIRCPSKKCGRYVLDVWAHSGDANFYASRQRDGKATADKNRPFGLGYVRFEPRVGVPLSSFVPAVVKNDYEEACQIKDLSPKAAATLCRRALQGMVRDFWKISRDTLAKELKEIEGNCDADIYKAMMSLKGVGNIGAHPERDINLIIDVDEGEVESLLELLHILDREWYVTRARRAENLSAIAALGDAKKAAAKASTAAALTGQGTWSTLPTVHRLGDGANSN